MRPDTVLDRPDHEGQVARQVRQMVFVPVAFLEFLEMDEGVVSGVEEEILPPAFPIVRPVPGRPARQHFGGRFQELERNQIEARLPICSSGAASETPDVTPVFGLNLAHSQMLLQT